MPWIQLKINATKQTASDIGDFLLENTSALAITYTDAKDTPVFEPLPGETRLWNETDLCALFDADVALHPIIEQLKQTQFINEHNQFKIEVLEDKDWEREWMDNFKPMQFGQRLWVCPSWHEIIDPNAVNVMLDPGLAFGTGTHPTTALCLEWLEGLDLVGKTVIDFGCGSGILAIAALKLGAVAAIGIDIDPQALLASKQNAQRNGVDDKLTLFLADQQPQDLKADVVVANILAGPLKMLAPAIMSLVKRDGSLALSGILPVQAQSVKSYYSEVEPLEIKEFDEWCRISSSVR